MTGNGENDLVVSIFDPQSQLIPPVGILLNLYLPGREVVGRPWTSLRRKGRAACTYGTCRSWKRMDELTLFTVWRPVGRIPGGLSAVWQAVATLSWLAIQLFHHPLFGFPWDGGNHQGWLGRFPYSKGSPEDHEKGIMTCAFESL
jgi:hypothetical protein